MKPTNSRRHMPLIVTGRIIGTILLSMNSVLAHADERCRDVLRGGVFDLRITNASDELASSYSNWFCSHSFSSDKEAENFGANIGFPFKGLPVKLGFESSKQSWKEWSSSFCQDVRSSFSRKTTVQEHASKASPAILKAFVDCTRAKGASVWLEHTSDPAIFGYAAHFDSPSPRIKNIRIALTLPKSVTCEPSPKNFKLESPTTFRATCRRADLGAIKLVANSSDYDLYGGGDLHMAAIPRNTLPPLPQIVLIDGKPIPINFKTKNSKQVAGCACGNSEITFPGQIRGKVGDPLKFDYDGSEICQGQDFRNFAGSIAWTGNQSTPMHSTKDNGTFPGIAGSLEVKFPSPGSYNVIATFSLTCIEQGSARCSNNCRATGQTQVTVD